MAEGMRRKRKPAGADWRLPVLLIAGAIGLFAGGFGIGVWIAGPSGSVAAVETSPGAGRQNLAPAAAARQWPPSSAEPRLTPDQPTVTAAPVRRPADRVDAQQDRGAPPITSDPPATSLPNAWPVAESDPGSAPGSAAGSAASPDAGLGGSARLGAVSAAWSRHAATETPVEGRPMIAVVLDDLGVDKRRSARAIALPAPLTLAFLPYARDVAEQAEKARAQGHELLVHLPMRPHGADADPGPNALDMALGPEEVGRRLAWNLSRFDGFVGLNNHMGSRFTESAEGSAMVAEAARSRGLVLLDSLTSPRSVLADRGRAAGVPTLERDVFLDDTDSEAEVRKRLAQTEAVARATGTAIAIGHPRDATVAVLEPWMRSVRERGFVLVPLTQVLRARSAAPDGGTLEARR